ncbi:glutathione synthetase [Verticillium dahliae VdLs.17]|uniref:Glutathione synthetase n=1 Tax=Verticillium dahliae (strain VdLs.17 / ATCC MYA-4575 / FGSC 10137) TaxID=498257 RepID=G2X782_VERDV|nr:glutathione synthetase [Verticillium dahliae VdLs.17]EGY14850.1 glutathione synthetase [Verticillium dahliae VdLs.17]
MAPAAVTAEQYPPSLKQAEQDDLVQTIKDWSIGHGLAVRPQPSVVSSDVDPKSMLAINVPVTLFPSPFPRQCFEQARTVQKTYNELYAAISRDEEFLADAVKEVRDGDEFTTSLWDIHLKVKEEGYTQNLSLGLFRSDYLVHQDEEGQRQVKQVEFNTIAASFGGLSSQTSLLHKFLASAEYPLLEKAIPTGTLDLPENDSARGLAAGIRAAHDAYGESELGHERCVLFIVQDGERNVFDQRHIEYALTETAWPIRVFRLPSSQILQHTTVADTAKRQLLYHLPRNPSQLFEVSVAYLRFGYGPDDYPDQRAWDARHHLERSAAIKCPTILSQVAGTKKVQQVLATPPPPPPPFVANVILRNGALEAGGVVCELGIYGTCLWDQATGAVLRNEEAGCLLRTKGDTSNEGGVAAGFGCMDSPSLV